MLFTPDDVYDNQFVKKIDVNEHDGMNRATFGSHRLESKQLLN